LSGECGGGRVYFLFPFDGCGIRAGSWCRERDERRPRQQVRGNLDGLGAFPAHFVFPCSREPVAQLVEHRTFNAVVAGSSPARLTIIFS
jgi:hypothetical protein